MFIGIQLLGILFGLIMIYFTYLYYKRDHYEKRGLIVWSLIWLGFIVLVLVPETIYGVMEVLMIERTVDFFVIGGFMLFSVIIFHLYIITKETQQKMEELVRKVAILKKEIKKQ